MEASYLYSQIFRFVGRRLSAYQSFYLKDDEEWKQCLLLCQTDEERATLYAIRGSASDSRALEEMQKIYELDPLNENLEDPPSKEIQELEKNPPGLDFNNNRRPNQRYHNRPRSFAVPTSSAWSISCGRCGKRKKWPVRRLGIGRGYLELLAGDDYAAGKTFNVVEGRSKTPR